MKNRQIKPMQRIQERKRVRTELERKGFFLSSDKVYDKEPNVLECITPIGNVEDFTIYK